MTDPLTWIPGPRLRALGLPMRMQRADNAPRWTLTVYGRDGAPHMDATGDTPQQTADAMEAALGRREG